MATYKKKSKTSAIPNQVQKVVSRPMPTGKELILLSRKYVDSREVFSGDDRLGFDYEVAEQKRFMEIVTWLRSEDY